VTIKPTKRIKAKPRKVHSSEYKAHDSREHLNIVFIGHVGMCVCVCCVRVFVCMCVYLEFWMFMYVNVVLLYVLLLLSFRTDAGKSTIAGNIL